MLSFEREGCMNLYTVAQIRELERGAIESYGISAAQLMERAGKAAFDLLQERWPRAKTVAVLCGTGNNGGDGFVLARYCQQAQIKVKLYHIDAINELPATALEAAQSAIAAGVDCEIYTAAADLDVDVVVDALLGIGLHGDVRGVYKDAIMSIHQSEKDVLSIDIPSGIDADTGAVLGGAVRATATITYIGLKQGLYTGSAPAYVGDVVCHDLGIPTEAFEALTPLVDIIEPAHLAPRQKDTHKGSFGHVLVIGGDCGMSGAVRMASEAAARTGAGLVSVATRQEHAASLVNVRPELMCHGVQKPEDLDDLLEKATVIVIGPGLGKRSWGKALLLRALESSLPKVVDADALNLLAEEPQRQNNWVLTPHPGEAARLLALNGGGEVQRNRFDVIDKLQHKYGGVCVLKGAGTLIKADAAKVYLCAQGNPGMASGGMGDVLSGVIGGLIAQGLSIIEAAKAGVYIHSVAADRAAEEGGERGLLAMDVVKQLRVVVNGLEQK